MHSCDAKIKKDNANTNNIGNDICGPGAAAHPYGAERQARERNPWMPSHCPILFGCVRPKFDTIRNVLELHLSIAAMILSL